MRPDGRRVPACVNARVTDSNATARQSRVAHHPLHLGLVHDRRGRHRLGAAHVRRVRGDRTVRQGPLPGRLDVPPAVRGAHVAQPAVDGSAPAGVEITDPRRPYVVVANHESFADMLLISHLPWEMKWLSKEDWFRYPLVGWLMLMAGDVKIIRGNKQSIVTAMTRLPRPARQERQRDAVPRGHSQPRRRDGRVQGRRVPTRHRDRPPDPAAGRRTAPARRIQKGDWRWNVTNAEVRVLEPIETTGLTKDDVGDAARSRAHPHRRRARHDEGLSDAATVRQRRRPRPRARRARRARGVHRARPRPAARSPRSPTSSARPPRCATTWRAACSRSTS